LNVVVSRYDEDAVWLYSIIEVAPARDLDSFVIIYRHDRMVRQNPDARN